MDSLINIILSFGRSISDLIIDVFFDFFIMIFNAIIDFFAFLIQIAVSLMPSLSIGPELFTHLPTPHTAICWLTWIFPVDVLYQCTQFYITLYCMKFLSGPILRLLKITT